MAGSSNYRVNIVTDVEDLIITNRELKATSRYIEQIQRLSDRLGRARYQSLIKLNTELKYMHRHLGNIYSLAIRLSRLRIRPKVFLIDKATPVLEALIRKLKSLKDAYIVARAKTGIDQDSSNKKKARGGNGGNNLNVSNIVNKSISVTANIEIKDPKFDFNFNYDIKVKPPRLNIRVAAPKYAPKINVKTGPIRVSPKIKVICDCCCGKKGNNKKSIAEQDGPDGKSKNKNKNNKKNPGKKQGLPKLWETIKRIFTPKPGSKPHKPGIPGGPNGTKGTLGKIFDFGKKILGENPGNMLKKIGKGAMKGGKKLLGPISIVLDIVDIATASPEERPAAITSAVLGSSLTTAGAAIGTMIAPGIGTVIGGLIGAIASVIVDSLAGEWLAQKFSEMSDWAGEKATSAMDWVGEKAIGAKDWIGEKASVAKDWVGEKASQATDWMSNKASDVSNWFSSQTKSLKNDFTNMFGYSNEPEKSQPAVSVNKASQSYNPASTAPGASLALSRFPSVDPGLPLPSFIQRAQNRSKVIQGMGPGGSQISTANGGKPAPQFVQITDEQMSSFSGFLKDFKTETNNQISVTLPPGAVQVTVQEDSIDFDTMALQVGHRIVNEVRQAIINRGGGDNSSLKKDKAVLV
jgi:gas vesicle protein